MTDPKREQPRLINLLAILLILQAPVIIFLGLNLVTDHWAFLLSWSVFWEDVQEAFSLVINTPGQLVVDETLFYSVIAFAVLSVSGAGALFAGLTFKRGGAFVWMMSLAAQIGTLLTGIGLYMIYSPVQAYWLIAIGILMVLYLNYGDVRQWFLQSDITPQEDSDA
jgi:hypothetical protein